jgi:hypothetical protein
VVHLQDNGYDAEIVDMTGAQLSLQKQKLRVPTTLESCHTAEIEGYVIEGHVPVDVIEQLLAEKPEIVGLAVPGMPQGSPGMGGALEQPLEILAFDGQGNSWVYTTWR